MKMYKGLLAASCLMGLIATAPASAATQIVNGSGKLAGATGVMVGGVSYDVAFLDGTCASVFGGCTVNNFTFKTQTSSAAAAQALFDQVFLNTNLGSFDSSPSLTNGCDSGTLCVVLNPYGSTGNTVSYATSDNYSFANIVGNDFRTSAFDSTVDSLTTFARFTPSLIVSAVPEPASWAMLIGGVGLVGAAMRRRQSKVSTKVAFA